MGLAAWDSPARECHGGLADRSILASAAGPQTRMSQADMHLIMTFLLTLFLSVKSLLGLHLMASVRVLCARLLY